MSEIPSRLAAALADRYALVRESGVGGSATVHVAGRAWSWDARSWLIVEDPDDGESRVLSLDIDNGEWTDHEIFPAPVARVLAVDPQGFPGWQDALGSAKISRWRPGGEVEIRGGFPFDRVDDYASMTPDARRFVCNVAGGIGADAWLLQRVDLP